MEFHARRFWCRRGEVWISSDELSPNDILSRHVKNVYVTLAFCLYLIHG